MKNFDFLRDINGFGKVHGFCSLCEEYQVVKPRESAQNGRLALEAMVKIIFYLKSWETTEKANLFELTTDERFVAFIGDAEMMKRIHYIRKVGNNASHAGDNEVKRRESFFLLLNLFYFISDILLTWHLIDDAPEFDKTLIPSNKEAVEPKITITPTKEADIQAATDKGAEEATAAISTNETPSAVSNPHKPTEISEAETRRLYIDLLLKEAGWEVVETEGAIVSGKACIEIEVQGMPNASGIGYADYVLFGNNGVPLAVVEAKRPSVDAAVGRHQAELYADCLAMKYHCQRPVIYYTNGFENNVIDGMGYPSRKVMGFHSQDELRLMIAQRARKGIKILQQETIERLAADDLECYGHEVKISDDITDRKYQKRVITSVCNHYNAMHRRALLVMATGTGKTRVSISTVDVLVRNGWVKHVLFLADRTELVKQAKKNFEKLLPSQTCSLLMGRDCDKNARILFSTYQTMINYIDQEQKDFTIGRFDLIIIDEAHRSVFGKYGAIFEYFDSLLLGLTATPRDEVDRSTYELFGMDQGIPTDSYEYQEAVDNGHLVPYKAFSLASDIITKGIVESELTPEQREQLNEIFEYEKAQQMIVGEYGRDIKPDEIFSYVYNRDTVDKVLDNLMTKGLKTDDGTRIGKTIIFAYNHRHAVLIAERFAELYPELGTDFCRVIDNYERYAESLLTDFEVADKMPQIAVSVDMLDTGIDVPEVLNLVFFKPVHSKIKFWQMIGRGTRLCKNLLGPGEDKREFYIFDHWRNFEYFKMHGNDSATPGHLSVVGRLFALRTDMKVALQAAEYQDDEKSKEFHDRLLETLNKQVAGLNRHRIDVRRELKMVEAYSNPTNWVYLSFVQCEDVKNALAPLIVQKVEDVDALKFDAIVLRIQLSCVDETARASIAQKCVIGIAQTLNTMTTIPQIRAKRQVIKEVLTETFWQTKDIHSLERIRTELRELVQYITNESGRKFVVDIPDDIRAGEEIDGAPVIKTYRQRVMEYLQENLKDDTVLQKIYRLERLDNDDVRMLERIFWQELGTQEEYNRQAGGNPHITNVAAFIRSIIGIDQEHALQKYRDLTRDADLTRMQEEYLRTIIRYVCQNGDIRREILANQKPFSNFSVVQLFGERTTLLVKYVDMFHDAIA
ncbi:MAG: DEAD/DEAH box helicase family protein, partial [Bacteroidaceae bacterium]|nr:DEAD/DEAH box helicase family protein [Bacteroidaceae bacterium]